MMAMGTAQQQRSSHHHHRARRSRSSSNGSRFTATTLLVAIIFLAATSSMPRAEAATLPLHVRWLSAVVPPAVAPALRDFYAHLPAQLCGLGPEGIAGLPTSVMDELCPLKAATRLGRLGLPGLKGAADSAAVARVAAMPVTLGGALILLAARDDDDAAALQQLVCDTLLYPKLNCRFGSKGGGSTSSSSGLGSSMSSSCSSSNITISSSSNSSSALDDVMGPLAYHLDAKDSVGDWLAGTIVPVAVAPLGATLATLPDALCAVPPTTLVGMPSKIREQLCPHNAALLPLMALLSMGRTASASLEAKLCDLLKRPTQACHGGRYAPDNATTHKLEQIKVDTSNAVYSWEPRVPRLSVPLFDPTSANLGLGGDALGKLSTWWKNETAPELRRYALAAFVPPALQPAVADLLEKLPDSVCSLPPSTPLPLAFTYQACPAASVLDSLKGGAARGRPQAPSWGLALAEVAMGAGGSDASAEARARVDRWVVRMCSAIYARDVACHNTTVTPRAALDVVGARAKPLAAEIVSRALAAMPAGQRKWLVDGATRHLQLTRARVHHLPRGATRALFGPLCTAGESKLWSIKNFWSVSATVTSAVDAAIISAVQPVEVLAAVVGEDEAKLTAAEICGVATSAADNTPPDDNDSRRNTTATSKEGPFARVGSWFQRAPV